jgi:hypothetical protein
MRPEAGQVPPENYIGSRRTSNSLLPRMWPFSGFRRRKRTAICEERISLIRAKIEAASDIVPGPYDFHYQTHKFTLNPPLSVEQLSAFEAAYRIHLPSEYFLFLTEVGNGGIGPGYGLIPLPDAIPGQTGSRTIDDVTKTPRFPWLSRPFPFTGDKQLDAERLESLLPLRELPGCLLLCNHGCCCEELIRCDGPSHGYIWGLSTDDPWGLTPTDDGFFDWYIRWIDEVLYRHLGPDVVLSTYESVRVQHRQRGTIG